MKRIINLPILLIALMLPTNALAYDFVVDGIYYNYCDGQRTVEVAESPDLNRYSGIVTIPDSVTYSGTTYSVTTIGKDAFYYCRDLTSIYIPNSVTTIRDNAFWECTSLTTINIPNSVTSIGAEVFHNCTNLTDINISNSITSISNNAFWGCTGLTNVIIPNSVTTIGGGAFFDCISLTSISIPNSVTTLGLEAFMGCSSLTSITIPNSITSIGSGAFLGTAWFNNQPDGLIYAGLVAYKYKGIMPQGTTITLKDSTKGIAQDAFKGCTGLTSIDIPNSVTTIGGYAFSGCTSLTSIRIPNSVTTIYNYVFNGCTSLTNVNIPNSITNISSGLFYGCSCLTSINIPNSVETIGGYAFYGCSGLSGTMTIPKNVTYIGNQAFNNDPSIETVTCAAETPPSWNDLAMFTTNVYNHSPLYVPLGSERAYMSDQSWGQFVTIIGKEIQDEVLATGISLNQSQMNLQVGSSSQLIATVLPDSATNKVVTWISSNPDIATVDNTGLVTAVASGKATITATTVDGSNLSTSCNVTVTEDLSNYDNYLSMCDTAAFHGDTIVIPIKMTNEASIISFQTDIFLPEGLELMQEDGEYIIDGSERMTRTHSIMSNEVSNGAIRVLCYSSNYKPFSGNSGDDLFYITVKVADDAEGDYTIQLKNTLLTNTDFVDLAAPDVAANVNVKAYLLGDANNSGTVSITDVVVTAQYVLELNPQPFVFEAADANVDGNITVADVSRIAWMVLNPTLNAPLRAPALWNNGDRMSAEDITLASGETRRVSILLDNEMGYNAFQLDLNLPEGLTASNFQVTDRAGSHAFDVNTLLNGNIRALCYSPALTVINGHEGALLTFDVTAAGDVNGDILVDGIELVTTGCQSVKLDAFTIGINKASRVNELATDKTIAKVEYFNLAGQRIELPSTGVTLIVTTYTDGTQTTSKVIK